MRLVSFLIGTAAASSPLLASAQERDWLGSHRSDGPYLGLSAGLLHITDLDIGGGVDQAYEEGFILGVQGGYKVGVLRAEAEVEYGHSGFDGFEVDGVEVLDIDGDFHLVRWNVGLYYDLDNFSRFTPYFGGGLGGLYATGDEASFGGDDGRVGRRATLHRARRGRPGRRGRRRRVPGAGLPVHMDQLRRGRRRGRHRASRQARRALRLLIEHAEPRQ